MYFEKPGKANTVEALKAAAARGHALGLDEIVLASTTGATAYQALEHCPGFKVTAVTYHCGFREPFKSVMAQEVRADLTGKGVQVVSATHALSGAERGLSKKHPGPYPVLLMADTLKMFGQGTKVAVEVAVMAADAGALSGRNIIAVGGSSHGADTALVVKPAHAARIFELKIREIICKPFEF